MSADSETTLDTDIVLVFGALRSGTTLFRLMLQAHDSVANVGEVDFLFDHLRRAPDHPTGWRYDKAALEIDRIFRASGLTLRAGPSELDGLDLLADLLEQITANGQGRVVTLNLHRHAEWVRKILPRVRIIHLLRDPRDVARSSIGMGWANTLYHGVDQWLDTEVGWERAWGSVPPPDQVLTLHYEALLGDPERELGRVCAFLGVTYDPGMLDYHLTSTYGPPDASLTEQWRHASTPSEIALVEGKAGALMRVRGYTPTGPGRRPGFVGRVWLGLRNRVGVWRFGIRRFGLATVLAEKVTRRLGLPGHRAVQLRMSAVTERHLK